tara:strand:- start:4406 stop:4591 length:186 start_codon:yes stop_codon:yes gene_type:complete
MPTIKINDQEYNTDDLSDKAKEQIVSLQFVQAELKKLEAQMAVLRTAQSAYSTALQNEVGD